MAFVHESEPRSSQRFEIDAAMVKSCAYKSTEWSNVFRSGKKLWYRSRLLGDGKKLVSAASVPALRKELGAVGIVLQRKVNLKQDTMKSKRAVKPNAERAAEPGANLAHAEAERAARTKRMRVRSKKLKKALKKANKAAARQHSEEVVLDEEKAEEDEFIASAGAREIQDMPLAHALSELKKMAELVPASEQISAAIQHAAGSVNEAMEVAKKAFLAIESAQLLMVPPRIRICLLMCPGEQFSPNQHLNCFQRLFPGKDVNVYVEPEELRRLRILFQEIGFRGGVVLCKGGSSRGTQILAALQDTALQDHCCAKHMWT